MPRWLRALLLLLAAADAWRPLLLTPHMPTRARRGLSKHTYHLKLHGWRLQLQENTAIRSPYYNECKFYKGSVINEENSSATVTECEGHLYGLLQIGGESFVLQPTRAGGGGHVLRRRDALLAEQPVAYNLTGDTVDHLELDLEDEPPTPHVRPRYTKHPDTDTDYFRGMTPVTRPVSGVNGLWLEMAIVADKTMLKFHSRERVTHYILALMNIVSAIFNDPSLGSNMTLVINKLYLYEEKDSVIHYGNVKKSLEAVNKWNYRHLLKLPDGSTGWDAAVWLTRAPLGGPSGFAPVGGVCSRTRSAAIDRDEGLTSAFVIAHELGHLLGLTHDSEDQCPQDAQQGSVMAPTVLSTLYNFAWSKCSKKQFHEKSKRWWCLHERSQDEGVVLGGTKELSNYVFTMDEQCRTEFGEGFSVCRLVKVRATCSKLWCVHHSMPHVCRSKGAAPHEGTPCGHNKWCVDRVCEPMPGHGEENRVDEDMSPEPTPPAPPRWEEWGNWTNCSTSCGYGLRTRNRNCIYKGTTSETACEGAGSQVMTCWAGACAARRDQRADFCTRRSRHLIPYVQSDESKECEGWCIDYSGGTPSKLGTLVDGTPCSYDRHFDVCYQGTCVRGQCNSSDTTCNWCPDGNCNNNTHYYTKQLRKGWTGVAVIPHGAHQLSVNITTPVSLRIALREKKRENRLIELNKHGKRYEIEENNYLKYDPTVPQNLQIIEVDSNVIDIKEGGNWRREGAVVAAGTLLRFTHTDTDVFIYAHSRLYTDLMIMAILEHPKEYGELVTVEVSVNYSTSAGRTRPMEFRWSIERGPCSASCGGGVRVVRQRCPRGEPCPPPRYETCNRHSCEFHWSPGEWEECSATCGDSGVQERQLFCVPANISISSRRELIRNSVSPALCLAHKPNKEQPCNRIPCPVYWQEMPWTQCSTTCGRGVSYRPLSCPAVDDILCGPKPRERRRRCRLRRCPRAPPCPSSDASQYCELFSIEDLKHHCQGPPFRKYCCNACKHADGIEIERRGNG